MVTDYERTKPEHTGPTDAGKNRVIRNPPKPTVGATPGPRRKKGLPDGTRRGPGVPADSPRPRAARAGPPPGGAAGRAC